MATGLPVDCKTRDFQRKLELLNKNLFKSLLQSFALVTARLGIVRNDGGSTSMGAKQGKTYLGYVLQYSSHTHTYVYVYLSFILVPMKFQAALYLKQKICSSKAMTWIIKKFGSHVLSRESRLPYLRQEIRSA